MITYDILQGLEKNCMDLMNSTSGINSGTKERTMRQAHEKILGALRKIIIANEMNGRGIICISGLQGAGKTSLMKNFYGLSDEYFNISLGRGEKIPIFISERADCMAAEMFAVCLNKKESGYEKIRKKLNPDEFIYASSGNEVHQNTMYLELCVPFQHLNNESFAFMLLPGFEKKNDYWQNLIDFSVKCSDTSIFVFNESSFSKYDNQALLNKIYEKFGASLIYAISQSDLSKDENAEVKKTCIREMKIAQGEEDRVVCVGEFSAKEKNDLWIEQLKCAIDRYCNSIETARKNCTQYIYEIIEDELRPEISAIKDCLGTDSGDAISVHLENSSYLNAFDKIIADRRKQLSRKLDKVMDRAAMDSIDKLEKIFTDNNYAQKQGVKDKRVFTRTVFGQNVKDVQLARERINTALKREDDTYAFQYAFFDAVGNMSLSCGEDNEYKNILTDSAAEELSVFETSASTALSKTALEKQNKIMDDAGALLDRKNDNIPQLKYDNPAETLKIIAELGVQHFSLCTLQESCVLNDKLQMPDMIVGKLQISPEEITKKIGSVDKVILGTLGITGIDILEDGAINAIPKIAEAFGVSVPIVGTAAAAIAVGVTGTAIMNDINRLKRTEFHSAKNTIVSIYTQVKSNYLNTYDEAMELIRDRIENNLIAISGVNKKMFQRTNAMLAMNKIENSLDFISREVTKDSYDIRNAFSG